MKRIRVFMAILLLATLLCACAKKPVPGAETTVTPGETAGATATAGTVTPSDEPADTPDGETDDDVTPAPESETPGNPTGGGTPTPSGSNTGGSNTGGTSTPVTNLEGKNIIPEASSSFTGVSSVSKTAWTREIGSPSVNISSAGYSGKCLSFRNNNSSFASPAIDISKYISVRNIFTISFRYKFSGSADGAPFAPTIRTDKTYSFSDKHDDNNCYSAFPSADGTTAGVWHTYTYAFAVTAKDVTAVKNGYWNFCFHNIDAGVTEIYIDDFKIISDVSSDAAAKAVTKAETWTMNEVVLVSSKDYDDPYRDVDVDLVLSGGGKTYTIPCFWDGYNVWRGRFYCPTSGTYTYTTKCTDTSNSGLHNQKSTVKVTAYSGSLDIYKRGFIKAENKYFVYNNGTPFFYLGDTHWSLGKEELSKVKTMASTRAKQGYTVIQSEPIGASFNLVNGVDQADIPGLHIYDSKFAAIADAGLVHANAEFFFPEKMETFIDKNGGYSDSKIGTASNGDAMYDLSSSTKTELKRLSRYWVARYSAFPVMWTLGQEVDNDFYWERAGSHDKWSYVNNPYRLVAEYINKYDAYKHPLTAHQENTGATKVGNSAFNDVAGHNWFAAQWSPSINGNVSQNVVKEYYNSSKPVVLYEGRYCHLWTKNFGARMQGWVAYLSGMYGYGWGGQDTWCYQSTYDEGSDSSDGLDKILSAQKEMAKYEDSYTYTSAIEMGYMRTFFENKVGAWNKLIPSVASGVTFSGDSGAFGIIAATKEKNKAVLYLYNTAARTELDKSGAGRYHPDDTAKRYPYYNSPYPENSNSGSPRATGTVSGLQNGSYALTWFDPVKNSYSSGGNVTVSGGKVHLPQKPSGGDMVLLLTKN